MVNIDYFASVGYALELLAQSPYHRQHKLGDFSERMFYPHFGRVNAGFT